MMNFIKEAAHVKPSQKQLDWFAMESYAFIHFGPNTFTDKEWGDGSESPSVFNPLKLDCDQWAAMGTRRSAASGSYCSDRCTGTV